MVANPSADVVGDFAFHIAGLNPSAGSQDNNGYESVGYVGVSFHAIERWFKEPESALSCRDCSDDSNSLEGTDKESAESRRVIPCVYLTAQKERSVVPFCVVLAPYWFTGRTQAEAVGCHLAIMAA
jgi:hypothetical protein